MNCTLLVIFLTFFSSMRSACVNTNTENLIFVSASTFAANAGVAAFNDACWTEANAQLGPEFIAVVSTSFQQPINIIEDSGTYVNGNGDLVANSLAELFDNSSPGTYTIQNKITLEDGTPTTQISWTGSFNLDSSVSTLTCNDFTQNTGITETFGVGGDPDKTDIGWWTNFFSPCNTGINAVYCAPKKGGSIICDPVFHGFDGSRFEFQGLPNQIFNIITSSNYNLNAEFNSIDHGTVMSHLGFKIGNNEIYVDANSTVVVNGEYLKESIKTDDYEITIKNSGKFIIVEGNGWKVLVKVFSSIRLDLTFYHDASVVKGDVNGVLGQTVTSEFKFSEDVDDFLVSGGMFSTDFAVNLFGNEVYLQKRNIQHGILKATWA